MLKRLRVIIAVASIVAVTLLFLDVSGFAARHWAWMAKIQLIPALLSLNLIVLAFLIGLTLLMGRIYCSVICPLGIFQDVTARIRKFFAGKKARNSFRYHAEYRYVRYTVLTVFAVLLILGLTNLTASALAGLLEPYSEYGRMASQLLGPLYDSANNLLADWSAARDNYIFSHVAHATQWPVLIVAVLTFVVIVLMPRREYCNTICPVGAILGILAKHAWLRPVIDTSRCNGCRKCERNCKGNCIDAEHHKIDYSRCVVCFDCLNNCSQKAIRYVHPAKEKRQTQSVDGRRSFITTSAVVAASLAANALEGGDGVLAPVKNKKRPLRAVNPVPAGSLGIDNLRAHCTACQLCIRSCPEGVLQPSTDLDSFMQPVMWFNEGYCRPECNKCSELCPAGAINPVSLEEKSSIKIGTAVVDTETCISASAGQHCGLCSRSCPAGAISMVKGDNGNMCPVVNEEACIGCGSCEYHCPVGTAGHIRSDRAAIHVEGILRHRTI